MRAALPVMLVLLVVSGCVAGSGTSDIPGIEVGMTRAEVRGILGPPDEEHVYQLFARDSVLWSLADSSQVPGHVWAPDATDAELSRLVAPGDTLIQHSDIWSNVGIKILLMSYKYTVSYERIGSDLIVESARRQSDSIAY